MLLFISRPYLWLPIDKEKPEVKLHFYKNSEKFQEIDIHLGGTDGDFYVSMDVSKYLGQDIEIKSECSKELLEGIFCYGEKAQNVYPFRPKLHFSPPVGWHNDPNGLIYANGLYHLYYQWNPYGVVWGNMHWGHAVSKNLLSWKHMPLAKEPNRYGTAYSGCAWMDKENLLGYGKDALLFYYTAAGGRNQWSKEVGNQFTQRLAVSVDGGVTLVDRDGVLIEHIVGENRDPKVFYHKESNGYIMLLYLDGYTFAIYRSNDLIHWHETQRFSFQLMWECPDLFELSVENEEEKKWVFWSADGYYVVGQFDGYSFTAESEVSLAYATKLPYAAQSYAGVEDRVISQAWMRMDYDRGHYRGLMSLPMELSLVKKNNIYKMRFSPVRELDSFRQSSKIVEQKETEISFCGVPTEISVKWIPSKEGQTKFALGNVRINIDFSKEIIEIFEVSSHSEIAHIQFDTQVSFDLRLIIDQEVIEFLGDDGIIYAIVETEENILNKTLKISSSASIQMMEWCELRDPES